MTCAAGSLAVVGYLFKSSIGKSNFVEMTISTIICRSGRRSVVFRPSYELGVGYWNVKPSRSCKILVASYISAKIC